MWFKWVGAPSTRDDILARTLIPNLPGSHPSVALISRGMEKDLDQLQVPVYKWAIYLYRSPENNKVFNYQRKRKNATLYVLANRYWWLLAFRLHGRAQFIVCINAR